MKHIARALGLSLTVLFAGSAAADPSFDCNQATTPDELAICSDTTLAQVDTLVARAFRSFEPSFQSKQTVGRALLRARNGCGADKTCILAAQYQSLINFNSYIPWVENALVAALSKRAFEMNSQNFPFSKARPERPGDCVRTRIDHYSTRWGDPVTYDNADDGIVIGYEIGIFVVSYDRPLPVSNLAIGQPVVVCLMSIPYDCPSGDDRGRIYYSSNPVTNGEWIMSDAQHMCGGA